jgi:hypothetical protein
MLLPKRREDFVSLFPVIPRHIQRRDVTFHECQTPCEQLEDRPETSVAEWFRVVK